MNDIERKRNEQAQAVAAAHTEWLAAVGEQAALEAEEDAIFRAAYIDNGFSPEFAERFALARRVAEQQHEWEFELDEN